MPMQHTCEAILPTKFLKEPRLEARQDLFKSPGSFPTAEDHPLQGCANGAQQTNYKPALKGVLIRPLDTEGSWMSAVFTVEFLGVYF